MKFQKKRVFRILSTLVLGAAISCSSLMILPRINQPAQAVFPGYNGKIIYQHSQGGAYDIFSSNPDGTGGQILTSPGDTDSYFGNWSADGEKIVFYSLRDGNSEIYAMNADGSNQTRLTNATGNDMSPKWSMNGSKIVFTSARDGNSEIYAMNADGSNQSRLTNATGSDSAPQWSPDGSKIVFTSSRDSDTEVYVMNSDGSNQSRLTSIPGWNGFPQWSPDGSKIVFTSEGNGNSQLFIMDANGTNQAPLTTPNDENDDEPQWSPDGSNIAFTRYDADWDLTEIGVIRVDGSNLQIFDLTAQGLTAADGPDWSADGKKIAFSGHAPGNVDDIFTVNANGANVTRITNDGNSWAARWQPIPNVAPIANSDSLSVAHRTSGAASVLANDDDEEDLEGSNLTITVQPSHGTASINAAQAKINYTPANGYSGSDSLTYQICDSFELDQKCSTAVLGISVGAPGAPSLSVSKVDGKDVSPGGTYTSTTAKPTFSGTSSPGADIRVEIHSDPIILTTTSDSSGNWSVTPTQPVPPGQHTVIISATLNGQTTTLDSFVLGIQAELPQAGASLLVVQAIGSAMVFTGYGLFVFDKHRRLRRHVPTIL